MREIRPLNCRILLVAIGGLLGTADGPRAGLDELQGMWQMISAERDGRAVPDDEARRSTLVIRGNTFSFPGDAPFRTGPRGSFRIDPGRDPKEIDATPSAGPMAGETSRGIDRIEGDRCEVCFARPGEPRPRSFAAPAGSSYLHSVWRRASRPGG